MAGKEESSSLVGHLRLSFCDRLALASVCLLPACQPRTDRLSDPRQTLSLQISWPSSSSSPSPLWPLLPPCLLPQARPVPAASTVMTSPFSRLLALALLFSTVYSATIAHSRHDDHDHAPINKRLPSYWYQPDDHPAHQLFKRGPPSDGAIYAQVGSPSTHCLSISAHIFVV